MVQTFLVGIFFDALVSGSVAVISFLFVVFLFKRWKKLDDVRRAYAWFWFFTMIVWVAIATRYFFVSFGYTGIGVYVGDIIVEGAIFFTGPPLFYFLCLRLFRQRLVANCLATLSTILAIASLYFLLLPDGMTAPRMTDFSADVSINFISLGIFSFQIVLIILLIFYDMSKYLLRRDKSGDSGAFYKFLYVMPLLVYVFLGAIDQSKIILDWPLVVFRALYGGAFLFAYLIIVEEDTDSEQYLVEQTQS